jgi:hypothetical protein
MYWQRNLGPVSILSQVRSAVLTPEMREEAERTMTATLLFSKNRQQDTFTSGNNREYNRFGRTGDW